MAQVNKCRLFTGATTGAVSLASIGAAAYLWYAIKSIEGMGVLVMAPAALLCITVGLILAGIAIYCLSTSFKGVEQQVQNDSGKNVIIAKKEVGTQTIENEQVQSSVENDNVTHAVTGKQI